MPNSTPLTQTIIYNARVRKAKGFNSVGTFNNKPTSPSRDRNLILKKKHALGVVPYFEENGPVKINQNRTFDQTRKFLMTAPHGAKRAAMKRRRNTEGAYAHKPESEFEVVWTHENGL